MKGFIEVTHKYSNEKLLISVAQIKCVFKDEDTNIAMACADRKNKGNGWATLSYAVKESYEEVVAKIEEATK